MTTPSLHQSIGLTIKVHTPKTRYAAFLFDISDLISSYSHDITDKVGYDKMTFSCPVTTEQADAWLTDGIGRHIKTSAAETDTIWEGFVNEISIVTGTSTITRGPLMDAANRVSCVYTPILDDTVDPPVTGEQSETVAVDNEDAQAEYGVIETILSIGNVLEIAGTNDAEQIRDTYLEENAWPKTSNELTLGAQSTSVELQVSCLGYAHYLDKQIYNNVTAPISVQISTKMADVIDADTNGWFSSANAQIDFNGVLVPSYEDSNQTALSVINSMLQYGGGSYQRYSFGVYDEFRVDYLEAPTYYDYTFSVIDGVLRCMDATGSPVTLSSVKPGRFALVQNMAIAPADLTVVNTLDPRTMFIESVSFSAPDQISVSGTRSTKVENMISRLGIGGL